ncbi:ATP-binding protein [Streptomyces sp. CB01881]|uniref:ATP-binding protein n=1 Tax=Streptomyces sp. CB01881 TaxID=2078691 RepID=UPI0011DFB621|nr:ATP-binding protein [Streptomyces sp. CB01881]TYC77479.1 ATP-binding protein [Streptomyces sp. CB01881]
MDRKVTTSTEKGAAVPRRESPLDQGDGPLLRFAGDLRALRERAGTPPYRQLALRAHCSAASLSVAAGGRRLPSLAVTLAYVQACGGDVREWQHRWQLLAAELAADTAARRRAQDAGCAPYPGAAAYEAADAERFYGREAVLDRLVGLLGERSLVMVTGPSGVGKSSLVRAGLLARMGGLGGSGGPGGAGPNAGAGPRSGAGARTGAGPRGARDPRRGAGAARPGARAVPVALLTPGERPMEAYALALARLGQRAGETRGVRAGLQAAGCERARAADPVLVVDQGEELRTRCRDARERARFLDALVAAAEGTGRKAGGAGGADGLRCRVVLVVRSDQGDALRAEHPALAEACRGAVLTVGAPAPDELRRAITEPALRAGCTVEGALLAVLISAVAQQPGALPLLSAALLETWRRRSGNALTLAGFQATGGFEGALARTAEALFDGLGAADRERARAVFVRLGGEPAPGAGGDSVRKPVRRGEFDDPGVPALLERLVRARLVVLDRDTVELSHHALPQAWPRLRDWLAEGREALGEQRRLTAAARSWAAADKDPELLYRGARLDHVRRRVAAGELASGGVERAFLSAAVRAAADDRRRVRRQSLALAGLAAAGGALLTLAGGHRIRRGWRD